MTKIGLTTSMRILLVTLTIGLLAVILGYSLPYFFKKIAPDSVLGIGSEFRLDSASGPVSLSDFPGQIIPVYFGYRNCPDNCPTSLTKIAAVMNELNLWQATKVTAIFISLDPMRDSVEKLAAYTSNFHPRMLGVTGPRENIDEVAKQYEVTYTIHKSSDEMQFYLLDHSADIYLMRSDGTLAALVPAGSTADELRMAIFKEVDQL